MRRIVGKELEEIEQRVAEGQRQVERMGEEALARGDVDGWLCRYDNMLGFRLVFDRLENLRERGLYEKALVRAYTMVRTNTHHVPKEIVRGMFECADRTKLLAAGDTLPGSGPWRVYRGVAGHGRARNLDGLSWTLSLDTACWFAMRYAEFLPQPAVVYRDVTPADVYFYYNGREEQDLVLRPMGSKPSRLRISDDEMREGVERFNAEEKRRWEEKLAAARAEHSIQAT